MTSKCQKFPLYVTLFPGHHLAATHTRVQKTLSTRAQSEEPWVEENPCTDSDRVEEGQASGPVSPPRSTKMPQVQGLTFIDGEAEQPEQPGTIEGVEAPIDGS